MLAYFCEFQFASFLVSGKTELQSIETDLHVFFLIFHCISKVIMLSSNYLQSSQTCQILYYLLICKTSILSTNHFALLDLVDVFVMSHCSLVEELSWDITDQVLGEYQNDLQVKQPTNYFIHTTQTHLLPLALLNTEFGNHRDCFFSFVFFP